MLNLYKKIEHLCQVKGIAPGRMCNDLGIPRSFVTDLKAGRVRSCSSQRARMIADYFGVSVDFLLSDADMLPDNKIPVYGRVPAGIPLTAIEDIIDYEEITPELAASGKFIALKIIGDSMLPMLMNDDVVIVRLQEDVDSGDIAIIFVNGDEATCKKIKKDPKGVWLMPLNPAFEPMFFTNKQAEELPIRVLGKVVELRRTL